MFPLEGELFQQGVKMSFSRKSAKQKEEYKIPEKFRKRKTIINRLYIFSIVIYRLKTNYENIPEIYFNKPVDYFLVFQLQSLI